MFFHNRNIKLIKGDDMKNKTKISFITGLAILLGFFLTSNISFAQQKQVNKAVKGNINLNGTGGYYYQFDSDNDGIPNCLDSDYVRPMDGSGRKFMRGSSSLRGGRGGYGPGNGTGNAGVRPQNGTGYGAGTGIRTGVCDGTGPKGNARRSGRR